MTIVVARTVSLRFDSGATMALDDFNLNDSRYFTNLAAAFVRGKLGAGPELSPEELIVLGRERGLRLHKFKCQTDLPRVKKILGLLLGLAPASLLDIGNRTRRQQCGCRDGARSAGTYARASASGGGSGQDRAQFRRGFRALQGRRQPGAHSAFHPRFVEALWLDAGARSVKIEYVLNHMIAVAKV